MLSRDQVDQQRCGDVGVDRSLLVLVGDQRT